MQYFWQWFAYYNSNIQTHSFRKKYHRELYVWPKHFKAIMEGAPAVIYDYCKMFCWQCTIRATYMFIVHMKGLSEIYDIQLQNCYNRLNKESMKEWAKMCDTRNGYCFLVRKPLGKQLLWRYKCAHWQK